MTDSNRVIYDIERCICHVPDACRDCSKYHKEAWEATRCMESLMADALELLKEQEPTRVESVDYGTDMFKRYRCPKCKVFFDHNHNYCPNCGKKVKWDE